MTNLEMRRVLTPRFEKAAVALPEAKKVIIWGNHSATQYPDLHHATVSGKPALSVFYEWIS